MNKILLLLLFLVSITQSESVEQGIGIAAETNPTAQPLEHQPISNSRAATAELSYDAFHIGEDDLDPFASMFYDAPISTDADVNANPTVPIVKRKCRCPWTKEEDARLLELVNKYGTGDWAMIASMMEGRTRKQCRERWTHYLNPDINKDPWTTEEETRLLDLVNKYGRKWGRIARILGRAPNKCRDRWTYLTNKITDAELSANISQQLQQSLNFLATTSTNAATAATAEPSSEASDTGAEQFSDDVLAWLREDLFLATNISFNFTTAATAELSYDASDTGTAEFPKDSVDLFSAESQF